MNLHTFFLFVLIVCTRGRIHGFKSGGGRERGAGGVNRVGMGRGFPLPSRLRGLGERRKLRQQVPGRCPRRPPATLNFLHFGALKRSPHSPVAVLIKYNDAMMA